MVIVSKEFDYGYLLAALGVIILILLAFMFVRTSKRVAKKTTKRK
jgi:Na+/melibiose symporter-like transporter